VELEELPHMINNPYHPPPPGSDDPHYGVDFTDLDPVTQLAIEGRAVQAVLPGKVALVIVDRFPYGNAVLVETQLEDIPAAVLQAMDFSAQVQEIQPDPALTCPDRTDSISWNPEHLTLYLLYAHLQEPPHVQPEDEVECGQVLGKVGGSGNALNPHLHLEIRAGPAGARLDGMAHYDASASAAEMRGYCDWRVSGWFSPLDPMKLLAAQE